MTRQPHFQPRRYFARDIIQNVSDIFGVPVSDLKGRGRKQHISRARQVCYALIRELTDMSLPSIGRLMNRDHSTVIYAIDMMPEYLARDPDLSTLYNAARQACVVQVNPLEGQEFEVADLSRALEALEQEQRRRDAGRKRRIVASIEAAKPVCKRRNTFVCGDDPMHIEHVKNMTIGSAALRAKIQEFQKGEKR